MPARNSRRETLPNGRPWPQHMQERDAKWAAKEASKKAKLEKSSHEALLTRLEELEARVEALEA